MSLGRCWQPHMQALPVLGGCEGTWQAVWTGDAWLACCGHAGPDPVMHASPDRPAGSGGPVAARLCPDSSTMAVVLGLLTP